ncbi:hypothetical protein GCM10010112_82530 [Actinoplanes lobatus]|uniref:G3E family GTPase n=1 Tax=Actinoplanes lobatus TaxID=113568 RepID=A0A7W7HLC8_9ACTN|nr:G3E family GTPase [Actinoplanes lobatus]GGN93823.1 hypothetical protein GCM10010112_82530 [Actinoplanes lobatus]GIE44858.1 hypothetical protein Alo02nite_77560 [Actinoplanes lobatus]
MAAAETAPGWVAELNGEHIPETIEYGINSLLFRAAEPFHPQRLWDFLDTAVTQACNGPFGDDREPR